ncbi:MAG: flagellar basal body L-ring protein FlgH [Alphaproteobacteria bacterium]|nr:flagellar basal body L-ring protein FlgH [Alphaproteobacteria bacterium]
MTMIKSPASRKSFLRACLLTTTLISLSACNAWDRMTSVGDNPKLAPIEDPTHSNGYVPVKMPMPPPSLASSEPNSLWHTGARAFFRDQRASRVGDILTVIVTISDSASVSNETKRSRNNADTASAANLLGFESHLKDFLPKTVEPSSLLNTASTTSNDGAGSIARSEQIDLRVAATIIQVLPNGNLVVQGKQQVGINYDVRELTITGVIRPQDISSSNTISYDQVAEARIVYGGRGII